MRNYIETPNLPQNSVDTVIISGELSERCEYRLNEFGVSCIRTARNAALYDAVAYHADMVMYHAGGSKIICEPEFICAVYGLTPILNICSGNRLSDKYPYDIAYNAARVGNYLICNKRYTHQQIIKDCTDKGITIINVKQGYAKCNVCIIDENSIITSDNGIALAAKSYGLDVLLTDDNDISLKGLNHGFFGGASGKIAPDKLAVNGNIKYHKNHKEIMKFANTRGIEIISLSDNMIEDIGSILPLYEKSAIKVI